MNDEMKAESKAEAEIVSIDEGKIREHRDGANTRHLVRSIKPRLAMLVDVSVTFRQ